MTERFDDKHCDKQWRERQKSESTGVQIGDQALTKPVTRLLFKKSGLDHWITYLNPDDPQNVRFTQLLQRGLRELGEVDPNLLPNLKATDRPLFEDAKILGAISDCLLTMICGTNFKESDVPNASVGDILEASSRSS